MTHVDINQKQRGTIFGLLKKLRIDEESRKELLRQDYGVTSLKDIGFLGAERMIADLKRMKEASSSSLDKRRKQLIAVCYSKSIMLTNGKFSTEKLDKWALSHGKYKKKLSEMDLSEVTETIFQLKKFNA